MFMIGGALGALESHLFPSVGPGFWALVALAGVLGGVMRSPLTGVIFALELTRRLDALLPLMIGASTAYALSVLMLKRSVLTEKIARRGFHLSREYDVDPLEILFVGEVMEREVLTFESDLRADEALATISDTDPSNVHVPPADALPGGRRGRPPRGHGDPNATGDRRPRWSREYERRPARAEIRW